jgi:hypothetical protein
MLDIVVNLHLYNMVLVLTTSTVAGVWGLILYFTNKAPQQLNPTWKIALYVAAGDGLLQALLGITLVLLGARPGGGDLYYLHYVYGGIVALALPVAVTYVNKDKVRLGVLIFALAALIIAAAAGRAMMTGLGIGA